MCHGKYLIVVLLYSNELICHLKNNYHGKKEKIYYM